MGLHFSTSFVLKFTRDLKNNCFILKDQNIIKDRNTFLLFSVFRCIDTGEFFDAYMKSCLHTFLKDPLVLIVS